MPRRPIAACDVADRDQLEALLDSIPAEHPLGAVIHSAGVLDDGVLDSLDAERLERVMTPKVDAAWHLHELTKDLDLSPSSSSPRSPACSAAPGQANYAAANSFLDALAQHRRARACPGLARLGAVVAADRGDADRSRATPSRADRQAMRQRLGLAAILREQGLQLFDAALARAEPLLAPSGFDSAALRAQARLEPCRRSCAACVRAARASGAGERWLPRGQALPRLPEAEREARRPGPGPDHVAVGPRPRLRRAGRSRAAPSRTSASTRSARSSCATGSAPPPACGCPDAGLRLPDATELAR